MTYDSNQLKKMADMVRAGALTALRAARNGHAGIALGAADIITVIYANWMRRGCDRFVLSAGHGSAMLYATLKLAGYDVGDLKSFRQIGGLPGHPEYGIPGVDATTGPLGQGIGNAVGMAMAAKICGGDGRVYCLCSDGDLMEGVAAESIGFAGRYQLNNLILFWDDNGISIDGTAQTEMDIPARMAAAGWSVIAVRGDNPRALGMAIARAHKINGPVFIRCTTTIGAGASVAGTSRAHGLALSDTEMADLIEKYTSRMGEKLWATVAGRAAAPCGTIVDAPVRAIVPTPSIDRVDISTRELSGIFLEKLVETDKCLIGGSADLSASTNVHTSAHIDITSDNFNGNFIHYGVREHAMGAIMNGMAITGARPYGSTFLVFSDYMRPSIRLAALMHLPVIYVFTHDSIAVGPDGPTHQPVEQLPSLRLIPNLHVWRPCNMAEVAAAWRHAIDAHDHPSAIILSRQSVHQIPTPNPDDINRGGYVIYAPRGRVRMTLIATGAEVPLAVAAAQKMRGVAVASVPCVELFRAQTCAYRQSILKGNVIAIEASNPTPWFEFADAVIGMDSFGMSGPGGDVYRHFGFDADTIVDEISTIMN